MYCEGARGGKGPAGILVLVNGIKTENHMFLSRARAAVNLS